MLYRELLKGELHNQRADFQRFAETQFSDLTDYLEKLQKLCHTSSAEIWEDLRDRDDAGALPSAELDDAQSFSFSFAEKWQNHEEARAWANLILQNRTTFCGGRKPTLRRKRNVFAGGGNSNRLV